MRGILILIGVLVFTGAALAQDPIRTDGDKYKVLLENDKVRVLDYRDRPGEKTQRHWHPDYVLYALTSFKRQLTLGDGKIIKREIKAGDVFWSPAQVHIGENIGVSDTHVLIIELKEKGPGARTE